MMLPLTAAAAVLADAQPAVPETPPQTIPVVGERLPVGAAEVTGRPGGEDYANSFRAGGYTTFGLSGALSVSKATDLFLDARNLANKKAIGDIGAVVHYRTLLPDQQAIFYPVERRAVDAGVRTRW